MPASWIAQDPILNQELLISTSIPYNRIDTSPRRMRRGSAGSSLRHGTRFLGHSADSLTQVFTSLPSTPDVPRSRKSSFSKSGPGHEGLEGSSGVGNCSTVVECDEPEEEAIFGFSRDDQDERSSVHRSLPSISLLNASTETGKAEPTSCKFTLRQWTILVILMLGTLTSSFAVCLFPPFYPRLAEEKGATASIYGFVIGTNCLTSFLVTPIIGKNLNKFGVMFSMVGGTLIGGLCCAISGFLAYFAPGWGFVVTSCFIRILHAVGNALVITGTFTYAAMEYQDAVGKIFSFTRTAMNLGQLLGPLVGGALYQLGGFYLPFVTMGGLQAFMGLVSVILLDEIQVTAKKSNKDSGEAQTGKKITIFNILSIPSIWFSFITFIVATMCNGFLSINLEPKVLRRFKLTPLWVGLLFGIKDGANSLSSPIWGYFCDKSRQRSVKPYLVLSALCVAASFIFMGAGAVIGVTFNLSVAVLVFVLCLNGVGVGGEQVVGVVDALHEATNAGYPDDPSMHGIIAGLWSSLSGAGRFISRVGTGILVDCIGFNPTAAIMTILQLAIAALTFIYMVFWECSLKQQASIIWESVTTSVVNPSDDRLIFTHNTSPSHCLMQRTVSIQIPRRPSHRSSFSSLRSTSAGRPRGHKEVASSSVPEHVV